jgi:hypothetical protein
MADARLLDLDEEKLLLHFVLPAERELVLECMRQNGGERPEGAEERMNRADELMDRVRADMSDQKAALMLSLSAMHCLDFSDGARALMPDSLKARMYAACLHARAVRQARRAKPGCLLLYVLHGTLFFCCAHQVAHVCEARLESGADLSQAKGEWERSLQLVKGMRPRGVTLSAEDSANRASQTLAETVLASHAGTAR